jgi:hypothetical protein
MGMPREHHAIFVETHEDLSGHLYQVTGNIQTGMVYEEKPRTKPEDSMTFESKIRIGTVMAANYPRIKEICQGICPPKKQFEGPRRLYPQESLRRCQEWTAEAIQVLVDAQVIQQLSPRAFGESAAGATKKG